MSAIPVIDIAALRTSEPAAVRKIADEMLRASADVGFFYVRNHDVPAPLIEDAFTVSRRFFESPMEQKLEVAVTEKKRGYIQPYSGVMQRAKKKDFRETFLWGREFDEATLHAAEHVPLIGPNRWPSCVPDMRRVLCTYFEACVDLGTRLLDVLALGLDAEPGCFTQRFDLTLSRGSTLYYPPQPAELGEEQFGIGSHTDWGVLTLLYQDPTGGLQVQDRNGDWVTAHPIADTFVVNVGDCLERWTNKRLLSNEHRVLNASDRFRQAIAVFVDPEFDTPIVPLVRPGEESLYPPARCGEVVLESFRKAYGN